MDTVKILMDMGYEPLVDFECYNDGDGAYIKFWYHNDAQPSNDQLETVWKKDKLKITKGHLIEEVKGLASQKILETCPEWKQRNLVTKSIVLKRKEAKGKATAEDLAKLDSVEVVWQEIEDITDASNIIEAEINKLRSMKALDAYSIVDNPNWP